MASNGAQAAYTPENVLAAVVAMRGTEREAKKQAHEYLERFQKSVRRELQREAGEVIPIDC